jgi:hypothetical protein
MREMSSSSWLRRGSSIVFDHSTLGPLIAGGALVSLRKADRVDELLAGKTGR